METLWLILLVGFIVLEALTTQLICIWFAGGAIVALLLAVLKLNTIWQISTFVLSSALLLLFTRRFVNALKSKAPAKTNVDSLIGETGVVVEGISNKDSKGCVKLRGVEWSARSNDGTYIQENDYVTVEKIDGVKLIVNKLS